MLNSLALFSGFALVLAAGMPAAAWDAAVADHGMDTPCIRPVLEVGRVAYLSAPMPIGTDDEASDGAESVAKGRRWQVIFEGNQKETEAGSAEALLAAVKLQRPIAVRVPTFHGFVLAQCLDAYETTDGDVGCEVEFWCDGPSQPMIPARHKHIALVRSNGEVQQAVAVHNERDEERIVQMGFTKDVLTWYTE